jgi:hypothetical protein
MTTARTSKTPVKADKELAVVQASTVTDPPKNEDFDKAKVTQKGDEYFVELKGKDFKLADELGLMVAMKFSSMADDDEDLDLGTLYLLVQSLLHEDSWGAFERTALTKRASSDEVMGVIAAALESFGGRPTGEPSGS